jgi:cytoskeleton protein RodZ
MADETAVTAGARLRQAREAQGLHIAALASSLKVPVRKLEALERDRYDELPDATFTRALAQTVCRALKVDAAPVLALLPPVETAALDHVASGINAPFRDKASAAEPALGGLLRHPATAIVALLLAGALAVAFWPRQAAVPLSAPSAASAPEPAASAPVPASAATAAPGVAVTQVETVHAAPPASAPAGGGPGLLTLRAREASWVEVVDGADRPLLSRTVQPGESVGLDGALPLKLVVGNAAATEIAFRGQPIDLASATRDNVARLELK